MVKAAKRNGRAERGRRPIQERDLRLFGRSHGRGWIACQLGREVPKTNLEAAPAVVAPTQAQVQRPLLVLSRPLVVVELLLLRVDLDEGKRVLRICRARGGEQRFVRRNRVEQRFVECQSKGQAPSISSGSLWEVNVVPPADSVFATLLTAEVRMAPQPLTSSAAASTNQCAPLPLIAAAC